MKAVCAGWTQIVLSLTLRGVTRLKIGQIFVHIDIRHIPRLTPWGCVGRAGLIVISEAFALAMEDAGVGEHFSMIEGEA